MLKEASVVTMGHFGCAARSRGAGVPQQIHVILRHKVSYIHGSWQGLNKTKFAVTHLCLVISLTNEIFCEQMAAGKSITLRVCLFCEKSLT